MPQIDQGKILFKMVHKKPIIPSQRELKENPPSRSAKLRYMIKKDDSFNFETDILKKFEKLIEIEKLGEKIWKKFFQPS